jgi:hypothetical protein
VQAIDAINFFEKILLDWVSCSSFRVPVVRLETARVSLAASEVDGASR